MSSQAFCCAAVYGELIPLRRRTSPHAKKARLGTGPSVSAWWEHAQCVCGWTVNIVFGTPDEGPKVHI